VVEKMTHKEKPGGHGAAEQTGKEGEGHE
jgi:hypothetical protein